MSTQAENWRVMTPEGLFETDLETLKQWIAEGCVHSVDKVSKGNHPWIEAGRAPVLKSVFLGVERDGKAAVESDSSQQPNFAPPVSGDPELNGAQASAVNKACSIHSQTPGIYQCRACATLYCQDCTKLINRVHLCPACGDLCKPVAEAAQREVHRSFQTSGFGMDDFKRSLGFPFQHGISLLCGAAIYGLLLMAGFRGQVVAYVLIFGCISHVINQVAGGSMDRNFFPDFTEFSLWDDLFVRIGLGLGIVIVTYGPLIILVIAVLFGIVSGPSSSSAPAVDASQGKLSREDLALLTSPDADPQKMEEANNKLQQLRPGYQIGNAAQKSQERENDPTSTIRLLGGYMYAGIAVIILVFLALGWAVVYYPMALAVAGYTESFGSVINPLVGLDTIRRMGSVYWKAFLMTIGVQIIGFGLTVVVAIVTSPFTLPFIGNLPGKFIDGSITFYLSLVTASILGLSLFKCADKLGIELSS